MALISAPEEIPRSAFEQVRWAQAVFGDRAVFACSFGAEDMVLLDMISKLEPPPSPRLRVVTLDTGRLFPETYDLMQEAHDRYGIPIRAILPDPADIEELVARDGPNLFYQSVEKRRACCRARKVLPLRRALDGAEAWMVGLRREQSTERSTVDPVARDDANGGIWKLCPLADWSWEDVLGYVHEHDVPINPLHAKGFPSIGCAPCTRAVAPGADPRSGRWWWESGTRECGLHATAVPAGRAIPPSNPAPVG